MAADREVSTYGLTHAAGEEDRLDVQHAGLKILTELYRAPVTPSVSMRVLDVGCGTHAWGAEFGHLSPRSTVVGVDVKEHGLPHRSPPNYHFEQCNVLGGLPFEDGTFDYVHQRLLVGAIPFGRWLGHLRELVRVTRPGGWVEVAEGGVSLPHRHPSGVGDFGEGPAAAAMFGLLRGWFKYLGLDSNELLLQRLDGARCKPGQSWLSKAGLSGVSSVAFQLPVYDGAGAAGAHMKSSCRFMFRSLEMILCEHYHMGRATYSEMLDAMLHEVELTHARWNYVISVGQRATYTGER